MVILLVLSYIEDEGLEEHPEGIPMVELYEFYYRECMFWGIPARSLRSFGDFLADLEMQKLVGSTVVSSGPQGRRKPMWT